MYSFEGDFRRKPQQNLAGASGRENRDALILNSQQQRQKREELRHRINSAIKIQATIRSFLVRVHIKQLQRQEFDKILKHELNTSDIPVINNLIDKILFFFDDNLDISRLITVSQMALKIKMDIIVDNTSVIRLRRLLNLHLLLLNKVKMLGVSLAIPMRMVEVFTSIEVYSNKLTNEHSFMVTTHTFIYLVNRGYFKILRKLLDSECPPMYDNNSRVLTPLCTALYDLIVKPIKYVDQLNETKYRNTIMIEFCVSYLSCEYSEPIHLYMLPNMTCSNSFPYYSMLQALTECCQVKLRSELNTTWMLYSFLSLEPKQNASNILEDLAALTMYLRILSELTENISTVRSVSIYDDMNNIDGNQSDSDVEQNMTSNRKCKLINECISTLNNSENLFMYICSKANGNNINEQIIDYMMKICYHLLLSNKNSLQYRSLITVSFSSCWLEETWRFLQKDPLQRPYVFHVFCSLYTLLINTLHDDDLVENKEGSIRSVWGAWCVGVCVCECATSVLHTLLPDSKRSNVPSHLLPLFKVCGTVLRTLIERDSVRNAGSGRTWGTTDTASTAAAVAHRLPLTLTLNEDGPPLTTKEMRTILVLKEIPFLIPFPTRVQIFQNLILKDKHESQSELTNFLQGPSINIIVRRSHLYEDSFDKLSPENEPDMRLKLRVQLINEAGADEAGVDGGGLLREFLSELLRSAFDPNRGLFRLTKDNMLYPNPGVHLLYDDYPRHYYFIGRILGKALYERVLVEVPLAWFFAGKLGRRGDADVHQLAQLDHALHRGLRQLRSHPPHLVSDLGLDFTLLSDHLGEQTIEELKPDGANIPVTAENRIEYIHLVADYKLNRQIRIQSQAFVSGVRSVVRREWLRMFSCREIQLLISGADQPVDINDLKRNTTYTGGYSETHPTIIAFWNVVENFNDEQRRQLLKFVTSTTRPPLLGFKDLQPTFCIQQAGSAQRLPSASTCMNLLKLPDIPSEDLLAEKLLYAIQSGAGFELS